MASRLPEVAEAMTVARAARLTESAILGGRSAIVKHLGDGLPGGTAVEQFHGTPQPEAMRPGRGPSVAWVGPPAVPRWPPRGPRGAVSPRGK